MTGFNPNQVKNNWLTVSHDKGLPAQTSVLAEAQANQVLGSDFAPTNWAPRTKIFSSDDYNEAEIVALASGQFLAVSSRNWNSQILGQLFNADGSKAGGEFVIKDGEMWTHSDIKADVLADGRVVVVWADRVQSSTYNLVGKIIDLNKPGLRGCYGPGLRLSR